MRLPIIAAMAVLLHALPPPAGAAVGAGSAETVLVRTDLAAPVSAEELDGVLARSSVFARLPANVTLRFLGLSLVSETDSAVFLGASADQDAARRVDGRQ